MSFDGFVVIDKPSGVTSFSVVALMRRLTGVRRVGHAGTLDPLASGVLPVAIGQATRFIEYLDDTVKVYLARIRFGVSTDTYDSEGSVTRERDVTSLSAEDVEAVLRGFRGEIEQRPPAYSAIKLRGKPLYRYARDGDAVEAPPRMVRIDAIELVGFEAGEAQMRVWCGGGTYIRSLAHDAGERLGVGGHLTGLVRERSGGFSLEDARRPDELRALADAGRLDEAVLAVDRAVERRRAVILGAVSAGEVSVGRDIAFETDSDATMCRAYGVEGDFLGVLSRTPGGCWHPTKMLARR